MGLAGVGGAVSYTGRMHRLCGWTLEEAARGHGALRIAGIDEVGRGPLFGPVVAAAVILPKGCRLQGLTDSKKLTEKKRDELEPEIRATAIAWAIAAVDAETIDRINIRRASLEAMRRAVEQLAPGPDFLLIDGRDTIDWEGPQQAVIHGDCNQLVDCRGQRAGQGASGQADGASWMRRFPATGWRGTRATARPNTWKHWRGLGRHRCTARAISRWRRRCCDSSEAVWRTRFGGDQAAAAARALRFWFQASSGRTRNSAAKTSVMPMGVMTPVLTCHQ